MVVLLSGSLGVPVSLHELYPEVYQSLLLFLVHVLVLAGVLVDVLRNVVIQAALQIKRILSRQLQLLKLQLTVYWRE